MNPKYPGDSLERLQKVTCDILKIIDGICKDNDIEYIVVAGTCLGAVRHQGFIPWDDDIDVAMPYSEWLRFIKIAQTKLPEGYSLHTPLNTEGFSTLWAKIYKDNTRYLASSAVQTGCKQGIFVDVFPYIELDKDPKVAAKTRKKAILCQRKLYLHYIAHPLIPKNASFRKLKDFACMVIHYTIARAWTPERMVKQIKPYLVPKNPSNTWINLGSADVAAFDGEWLFPAKEMKFEDFSVMAPNNPDPYLRADYGDYMQIPSEEDKYFGKVSVLDFGDGINVMEGFYE